jgi:hypothetical protein
MVHSLCPLCTPFHSAQSIVAPLGSMTLVANVVIAPVFLKEVVSKRDVLSTLLIVAGCAVAVAFASHSSEGAHRVNSSPSPIFLSSACLWCLSSGLVLMRHSCLPCARAAWVVFWASPSEHGVLLHSVVCLFCLSTRRGSPARPHFLSEHDRPAVPFVHAATVLLVHAARVHLDRRNACRHSRRGEDPAKPRLQLTAVPACRQVSPLLLRSHQWHRRRTVHSVRENHVRTFIAVVVLPSACTLTLRLLFVLPLLPPLLTQR